MKSTIDDQERPLPWLWGDSGLRCEVRRLQDAYAGVEEFETYDETYGISRRLGFAEAADAWKVNPVIKSSVNPRDLSVVSSADVLNFLRGLATGELPAKDPEDLQAQAGACLLWAGGAGMIQTDMLQLLKGQDPPAVLVGACEVTAAIMDAWHGNKLPQGGKTGAEILYDARVDVDGMVGLWMAAAWLGMAAEDMMTEQWEASGDFIEDVWAIAAHAVQVVEERGPDAMADGMEKARSIVEEAMRPRIEGTTGTLDTQAT